MNTKTILLKPAASIICAFFSLMILFVIIGGLEKKDIPKDTHENNYPVLKGPRPYKPDLAVPNMLNDDSNIPVNEKESLYSTIINEVADKHDIDPALIKAIIMAESRYNPLATSEKGAIGLMQIMPGTASTSAAEDMYNPIQNITIGVEYLKELLNQFDGNLEFALAAYNAGPGKVLEYQGVPPYAATIYFVKKVFEYYNDYLKS
jgi:soluble lytic murein transglycosylase-like protein